MFSNIGGLEVLFVMVVALIVLGPNKLPEAARQVGKFVGEVRRISAGFQREFREAVQDPIIEAEARARGSIESAKITVTEPFTAVPPPAKTEKREPEAETPAATPSTDDPATPDVDDD